MNQDILDFQFNPTLAVTSEEIIVEGHTWNRLRRKENMTNYKRIIDLL
jgi:outer membrane protein OmpA-like peptidoglycan-associated protein